MERLVHWLSYSKSRAVARVFSGFSEVLLDADPQVQERIIRKAERRVYGKEGLQEYEHAAPSRLHRLARRSLAQHLCQKLLRPGFLVRVTRAGGATFCAFPLVVLLLARSFPELLRRRPSERLSRSVVFQRVQRLEELVWDDMFQTGPVARYRDDRVRLGMRELRFFGRAIRACPRLCLHPELVCHVLRWLAYYGYAAWNWRPELIANFSEGTAASSLMTAYTEDRKIRHCGLQHGEIFFSGFSAFAEFHEFRAWGIHFTEILERQHMPPETLTVSGVPFHRHLMMEVRPRSQPRPKRLLIVDPNLSGLKRDWSASYLRLLRLLDGEWEVKVRRHPSDRRQALDYVSTWNTDPVLAERGVVVSEESPDSTPIEESLGRSRLVAGVSSAALLEAWLAGCKVVYIPGGPVREALLPRHGGSANIWYLDDPIDQQEFLESRLVDNACENDRIRHLLAISLRRVGGPAIP